MTIAEDIAAEVLRIEPLVSVPVTGEPRDALGARDCAVLVEPPERDYKTRLQTWTLVIVRNSTDLGLATTTALGAVLADLEAAPALHLEEAKPGARRLSPDRPPLPAYFAKYTTP